MVSFRTSTSVRRSQGVQFKDNLRTFRTDTLFRDGSFIFETILSRKRFQTIGSWSQITLDTRHVTDEVIWGQIMGWLIFQGQTYLNISRILIQFRLWMYHDLSIIIKMFNHNFKFSRIISTLEPSLMMVCTRQAWENAEISRIYHSGLHGFPRGPECFNFHVLWDLVHWVSFTMWTQEMR